MKKVIKVIGIIIGTVSLIIGSVGMVLPILPTVPFYLLTAALYAKNSEKFHKWFLSTGLYKKYMNDVITKKEMTKERKIKVMITLALIFIIAFLVAPIWHVRVIIIVIAVGHLYYFLFRIKTAHKDASLESKVVNVGSNEAEEDYVP